MTKKIVSPFEGDPPTEQFNDKSGNTAFRVTPKVLTPLRVKFAEALAGLSMLGLMGGGLYALTERPDASAWLWGAVLLGPPLAFPLLNRFWQLFFYTETKMVLTIDEFRVRRWYGWHKYDRTLKHEFALVLHDKTQAEKDANELAVRQGQARGQVIAPKRYYSDSFHLSFEYLGQRNDVLTVYGHKEAWAIMKRLTACDERLNKLSGMGDGIDLAPEDQWTDQPGGIS
jgi:hypothetical protein